MKKEIFLAIVKCLTQKVPEVKYIDLWNEHLAEITTGSTWPVPSVFIEYAEHSVRHLSNRAREADIPILIHIITRAQTYAGSRDSRMQSALSYFDIIDKVDAALEGLSGDHFSSIMLVGSRTNHNHSELIESIETFTCRAVDLTAARKYQTAILTGVNINNNDPHD